MEKEMGKDNWKEVLLMNTRDILLFKISQKRFRKMLYSVGYGRNEANRIIKFEHSFKGYYSKLDIERWRRKKWK